MTAVVVLGGALALVHPASSASEVVVTVGHCQAGIELMTDGAPLSTVLGKLSESLGFRLHFEQQHDPPVRVRMSATGPELVSSLLSTHGRFMMTTSRDPRCPGQLRVARVWVLPAGEAAAALRPARPQPPAPSVAKPPATVTATPEELRRAEERSRQLKQAYDAYVKAHGHPPPGEEQEEARP
jgi:hypothetical protein